MNKVFPQTMALELSEHFTDPKLKAIGKWGCCALVSLWIMGIEGDIGNICLVADEMGKGLDNECTVNWVKFFSNVAGRKITVTFKEIKSLEETKKCGRCAVRYDYNGQYHWVGVEKGKIAYNPLRHSVCVTYGKPTQLRIIKSADGEVFKWN